MSSIRPLRGSCHCGRCRYVVQRPLEAAEFAQVFFDADRLHQSSVESTLPAFLRVPLSWYRSSTHAQFPHETHSMISRFYSPPETTCRRGFCGFCATPLSFWSEQPRSEADYIQVPLSSLFQDDLHDLQELGYIPADLLDSDHSAATSGASSPKPEALQPAKSVPSEKGQLTEEAFAASVEELEGSDKLPWFDSFVAKDKDWHVRRRQGGHSSSDGKSRVWWEVVEWTSEGDDGDETMADSASTPGSSKRKRSDTEVRE